MKQPLVHGRSGGRARTRQQSQQLLWSLIPGWLRERKPSPRVAVEPVAGQKPVVRAKPVTRPRSVAPTTPRRSPPRVSIEAPAAILGPLPEAARSAHSLRDRYPVIERAMLKRYGIRVRKWRGSTSGVAWLVQYRDGSISRLIESPQPRGPMSLAVFLHEVGHHAIGLGRYKPRCLEEFHAWAFSLYHMQLLGMPITERVSERAGQAMEYALEKAVRRGLKRVPPEVAACVRASRKGAYYDVRRAMIEAGAQHAQLQIKAGA